MAYMPRRTSSKKKVPVSSRRDEKDFREMPYTSRFGTPKLGGGAAKPKPSGKTKQAPKKPIPSYGKRPAGPIRGKRY